MTPKERRFQQTISFLAKCAIDKNDRILDLGTPNQFSEQMKSLGYRVENTNGQDLDLEPESLKTVDCRVVTAFEILEHLVNPFTVLKNLPSEKLIASIPLRLWFSSAYRNENDPWDRHFHEFEDWQFDWLLEKSGWKIERSEKWTSPSPKWGIRPVLRRFTPRYYIVEATRV